MQPNQSTRPISQPPFNSPKFAGRQARPEYDEDDDSGRAWRPSIQGVGCTILIAIFMLVAAVVLVVIFKPSNLWNPLKDWLNAGLVDQAAQTYTKEKALGDLKVQIGKFNVGDNKLLVSEQQARALIESQLAQSVAGEVNVRIIGDRLKLYWNTDTSQNPLWAVMEVASQADGQAYLAKVGFERLGAPAFLNDAVSRAVLSALQLGQQRNITNLVETVLPLPENVQFKSLQIQNQQLEITLNVKTGLEDLF